MTIFLYEHLCAMGFNDGSSMGREGRAMRDALAEDFAMIPGAKVVLGESTDEGEFRRQAKASDWALVVAPETDSVLERYVRWASEETQLLGPDAEFISVAADKVATSIALKTAGIDTPNVLPFDQPLEGAEYPQIWKPRDGCGSQEIFYIPDAGIGRMVTDNGFDQLMRTEYIEGIHASIAFLCGPNAAVPLLPCWQRLSDDGRFTYLGGEVPLNPPWADRVRELGMRAINALRTTYALRGYIGLDIVIGDGRDAVIEINPRITTSYTGLRRMSETNLAEAMLGIARGEVREMQWMDGRIRFPD